MGKKYKDKTAEEKLRDNRASTAWLYKGNKGLLVRIRTQATRRGIPMLLTIVDIPERPSHCPILGIPLDGSCRGNKPSIDRIDNTKPYIPGNIQFLSERANSLKKDASLEELMLLGEWAKRQHFHS